MCLHWHFVPFKLAETERARVHPIVNYICVLIACTIVSNDSLGTDIAQFYV